MEKKLLTGAIKQKSTPRNYKHEAQVSPSLRAKIEFEVDLIGKLIEAREQMGFTQAQLAEAAGIKQSAVARMESLKATPQIDTLFKVLMPLGYKLAIVPNDEGAIQNRF